MNRILFKLITGMALGAAVGILLAPQRGAETRQQLARRTAQLRLKSKEVADRLRESEAPRRLAEGSRRAATGMAGALSSTGQQVGRMMRNAREEMRSGAKDEPEWEGVLDDADVLRREWEQESGGARGGSATWILVGALTGVAIGVLVAPKAGEETREELARKARQLRHQGEETAARVVSRYRCREQ